MTPESEATLLDDLHGEYSDFYKELNNIRPWWVQFDTVDQANEAIES